MIALRKTAEVLWERGRDRTERAKARLGVIWRRQQNAGEAHGWANLKRNANRVPLRNIDNLGRSTIFAPLDTWRGFRCDLCRASVTVLWYLGTKKSGLCCYVNNLIREYRTG